MAFTSTEAEFMNVQFRWGFWGIILRVLRLRVVDPYSFFPDPGPDPRVWGWRPIRIRIQSGSNPDPDPIRIQGFNDQNWKKITAEFFFFFWSKSAIYLSLGLHKVCPSYRRSLQLSKEAIQHFKTWTFTNFSIFVGHFPLLDPDPDPQTRLNPDPIRIRIHNPE